MKLKEFFKPNAVKLIITIILIVLIPFAYYIYPCPEISENINSYIEVSGMSLYDYLNIECGFSLMSINKLFSIINYSIFYNLLIFFIIHIIDSYIISCILVYVYNRIKRINKLKNKK